VSGETVLEVGPGTGSLTETLLEAGAKVIAVEKDDRLIPILEQKFQGEIKNGNLTIVHGDILEYDISLLKLNATTYKLIANPPYYITGVLLRKFLETNSQPSCIVLLIQKEVAERIAARDGKESLLSISVKAFGTPKYISTVKAGNLRPAPKVDSAVLAITDISKKMLTGMDEKKFFEIAKAGFSHKRKMISGNLKIILGDNAEEKFSRCKINPDSRAEELTIENWLCLSKNY
jgi:16S rRNA (adenine1518-N6/adenine1519-N6)-dimethyltransferase